MFVAGTKTVPLQANSTAYFLGVSYYLNTELACAQATCSLNNINVDILNTNYLRLIILFVQTCILALRHTTPVTSNMHLYLMFT